MQVLDDDTVQRAIRAVLEETLSVHQTSVRLNRPEQGIYRALRAGKFPARSFKLNGEWRIYAEDLDRLLAVEDGRETVNDPTTQPGAVATHRAVPGAGAEEPRGAPSCDAVPPAGEHERPPPGG